MQSASHKFQNDRVHSQAFAGNTGARSDAFKDQNRGLLILETLEAQKITTQENFDHIRGAIANPQPNDFRGRTLQKALLVKVTVFGDDDQTVDLGVLPNTNICGLFKSSHANMLGTRINVGQSFAQCAG